jgi:uncharacterized protein YggE
MRRIASVLLLTSWASLAFGQMDSNSITVTASNNVTLQPDQAIFSVSVTSPLSTGLDDVLAALQGSGITVANFSGVSTNNQFGVPVLPGGQVPAPTLVWSFNLPAPLANTKTTVASLTTLQQNIAKANNGLTMSFSIVGTQVSQQLAQSQACSLSSLITSATAQAQALAAAGSLTLGPISALSSSTSNVVSNSSFVESGAFISTIINSIPPPCAVTVKFSVTRY